MIVSKVFSLASLGRDFLLRWRFIEIDLHPRLQLTIIEWAISFIELFACHPTMPFRMSLSYCRHASSKFKHFLWKGFVPRLYGGAIIGFLL
jgi:hypothetical protein